MFKVIVTEQNEELRELLVEALEEKGFQVVEENSLFKEPNHSLFDLKKLQYSLEDCSNSHYKEDGWYRNLERKNKRANYKKNR